VDLAGAEHGVLDVVPALRIGGGIVGGAGWEGGDREAQGDQDGAG
jgi:hypothetical protein